MGFLDICISSFEKVLFSSVAHSLLVTDFGRIWFLKFPAYSVYQSFVQCIAGKYFLPLCGWSLQFRKHLFCSEEAF
jgi:hypothetical protein